MGLPVYEVDVPTRSTTQPGLEGVHVFTGRAASRSAAVRIAHEVYDAARAACEAGLEIPHDRPDGWGARGYRPRLGARLARRDGRPLEQPIQLAPSRRRRRLRAVALPRDSRSACRLRRLPRAHPNPYETRGRSPVWTPSCAHRPTSGSVHSY